MRCGPKYEIKSGWLLLLSVVIRRPLILLLLLLFLQVIDHLYPALSLFVPAAKENWLSEKGLTHSSNSFRLSKKPFPDQIALFSFTSYKKLMNLPNLMSIHSKLSSTFSNEHLTIEKGISKNKRLGRKGEKIKAGILIFFLA